MPHFGKTSLNRLEGVDSRLVAGCVEVVTNHWDCSVIYGVRSKQEQQKLFDEGLSKTLNSRHLTGHAVDLAPYPIDWSDTSRFYYFGGRVMAVARMMNITLRWGGTWDMDYALDDQKFMDLLHFEIPR